MVANLKYISPEEYLRLERKAEIKSEYVNGVAYSMAGGTKAHSLISVTICSRLFFHLADTPCETYNSDMKVCVPSGNKYFYPDVSVACGRAQFADDASDVLLNPILIVEVLSDSTAVYDRGEKFAAYKEIDSLSEYLVVESSRALVEQHIKQPDGGWNRIILTMPDDKIDFASIDFAMTLRDIYAKAPSVWDAA